MRIDWMALPKAVMTGVAERTGGTHATPASSGDHAEIAASLQVLPGEAGCDQLISTLTVA